MWKIIALLCCITLLLHASEKREWDQKKAVEKVQKVIEIEKNGKPWENIKWNEDPQKAIALSKKLGKPIFLYLYVSQGGPTGTNC